MFFLCFCFPKSLEVGHRLDIVAQFQEAAKIFMVNEYRGKEIMIHRFIDS